MILVTGGLGFIGSAYVWHLNQQGHEDIVIYDSFRNGEKWKNVRGLRYQDVILSDQDLERVEKYSFEAIVHLGACSSTTETDMDFLFRNNYELSKQLWYLCAGNEIPYIYASSAATYGGGEHGFDDEAPISPLMPLNKYGYSKQLFDLWVERQAKSHYIHPPLFTGLKFFNVFGPNEYHKGSMASVAYHAYHQIKESGRVKLFKSYHPDYPDGGQQRDFVYVKDVCEQIDKIRLSFSENKSKVNSGFYNVGCGRSHTFLELAEAIFKAMDLPPEIDYIEMPESLRPRYQYFTEAKMNKLGHTPDMLKDNYLEQAVKDYVQYLDRENPYLTSR